MRYSLAAASIVLALATVGSSVADADPATPFDGVWNVVIACADASDGAASYTLRFSAQVRSGAMLGQFSSVQTSAMATVSGQIQPNGQAFLRVDGKTGDIVYTVGRVRPGTPYHYTVNARFAGNAGSGTRNELRSCNLNFTKA
ncbi:MAG TPA: hypothetical protein VHY35_25240 [Stellaceae bacterium]|jgi:hypothetical protein|nr:hypothetical protein [Stellaceae bacterium]